MKIQEIEIDKIKPYKDNPRKNLNVTKVAKSIKDFGFQQPIVVDKNMIIIVGHTRYEASKSLNLKTVPVIIADLTPLKAKAYRIADNRLNEDSSWNLGLLNKEFGDLLDVNYDLSNLGFYEKELEDIITGVEKADIDVYVPKLEPGASNNQITDKNIEKAQDNENNKFQNKNVSTRNIICPSCYEEFSINDE